MIVKKSDFAVSLFLLLSVPFFALVAVPVLQGKMHFQFYLDSATYHAAADQLDVGLQLISLTGNFFGPILIIKVLQGSFLLIYLFNIGLFLLTYRIVCSSFPVNRLLWVLVMMAAPLTFTSLFSVNKEIVVVFVTALFAASYAHDKPVWRWIAIVAAILARWQMMAALICAWLVLSPINPLRRHRLLSLVLMVAGISIVYPLNLSIFEAADAVGRDIVDFEGWGIYPKLVAVQNQLGGYLLVFIPKALQLFIGMIRRWHNLFQSDDIMNGTILWFQTVAQLCLLSAMVFTRRLRLSSGPVYLAMLIAAVIALSPLFATRFLLSVYVLFAIELATPKHARGVPA